MFILHSDITCIGETIPGIVPYMVTLLINVIKIAVPVILIVMGMLDMGKSVMAQKEDEIKKGQQMFIKRLIAAALVFLVVFFVQLVVNIVAPSDENDEDSVWGCVDKMINYSEESEETEE